MTRWYGGECHDGRAVRDAWAIWCDKTMQQLINKFKKSSRNWWKDRALRK